MSTALRTARDVLDGVLRGRGPLAPGLTRSPALALAQLAVTVVAGGFLYGAVMGSFAGRPLQALYSGIKVPMLIGVSTLICLPSFYAVNAVLGLGPHLGAALRGVLSAQSALAVTLASLAPVTVVFYLSTENYALAVLFNGLQFAIATAAGHVVLCRHYRPLVAADPRHRLSRAVWLTVYVFVAIQMAWVLRPFVGAPDLVTAFFREDAWSNAYVRVIRAVQEVLGGR